MKIQCELNLVASEGDDKRAILVLNMDKIADKVLMNANCGAADTVYVKLQVTGKNVILSIKEDEEVKKFDTENFVPRIILAKDCKGAFYVPRIRAGIKIKEPIIVGKGSKKERLSMKADE